MNYPNSIKHIFILGIFLAAFHFNSHLDVSAQINNLSQVSISSQTSLTGDEQNRLFRNLDNQHQIEQPFGSNATGDSLNVSLLGSLPTGPSYTVDVKNNIAYFGNGRFLEVVDFSNPSNPVELGKMLLPTTITELHVKDNYVYLIAGDTGLRVIDVSVPGSPYEISSFSLNYSANRFVIVNNYAYITELNHGLYILDISNANNIVEAGHWGSGDFTAVEVRENYAYICSHDNLHIIDISTPATPLEVSYFECKGITGIAFKNDYAYVTAYNGFFVIDVSDPNDLQEIGSFSDQSCNAKDVQISGNYAFLAMGACGLYVLNISAPENPRLIASFNNEGFAYNLIIDVNYAYIADRDNDLYVIDVSIPGNPRKIGYFNNGGRASEIAVNGNYAYIAGTSGLQIIDISTNSPVEVGYWDSDDIRSIAISDNYAYIGNKNSGLQVIDIHDPANPQEVGSLNTGNIPMDIAIKDNYAYIANFTDGLSVINISTPASPREVRALTTYKTAWDIAISGSYAYLADSNLGLRIIDISNASNPQEVGNYDTENAYGVAVSGDFVYLAVWSGLQIIDASDVQNPQGVGYLQTDFAANEGMAVRGNYLYFAGGSQGLRIIDVSVPAEPHEIGHFELPDDDANDVVVEENYIYVVEEDMGLHIYKFLGLPPEAPILLQPANNSYTNDTTPTLTFEIPEDADGDELYFDIRYSFSTDTSFLMVQVPAGRTIGFSPPPPVPEGSGSISYTIENPINEGEWWWLVHAYDGEQYSDCSEERKFTVDLTAPACSNYGPAKNATGVLANTNIVVQIRDALSGVDQSSIVLKVDGVKVTPSITGSSNNYILTYNPPNDFQYEQTVTVSIDAADITGNVMPTDTYSFTTGNEKNTAPTAPTLTSPDDKVYINNSSPTLTWNVPTDTDGDNLNFRVEISTNSIFSDAIPGSPFVSASNTTGFNPTPPVSEGDGTCSYALQNPLDDGSYYWRVYAWDGTYYSNPSASRQFSVDTTPPYTEEYEPGKHDTNVSTGTNIVVHIKDNTSGVDQSSIVMKVNSATVSPSITGSSMDYTVTYDPPTDFSRNETIYISLTAEDNAGNTMTPISYSFSTELDLTFPQIISTENPVANYNEEQIIVAEITDDGEVQTAMLYYREGGSNSYFSVEMTNNSGNTYKATIPANKVTELGLEYYMTAEDNSGNMTIYPNTGAMERPKITRVVHYNLAFANATPSMAYRMVSVPSDLSNSAVSDVLEDDLGSYDDTLWRLLRYEDGANVEYGSAGFAGFEPGAGFWLITKEATSLDAGEGFSVTTAQNYSLTLQPGWNQIGNPFAFPVNWSDVVKNSDVENRLVGYYGNQNEQSGYDYACTQLVPWQGYFVNNLSSSPVTIEIPPKSASATLEKHEAGLLSFYEFQENEWGLQITAESGTSLDKDNYLGCLLDASDMRDCHDFSEAPFFAKHVSLYFPHQDWASFPGKYSGDFCAPGPEGRFWDFCVKNDDPQSEITLKLADIQNVPEEWDVILVDQAGNVSINLKGRKEYSFLPDENEDIRNFRIVVGGEPFIESNNLGIPEMPQNFELSQNYPNPFNPDTRISYTLPEAANVRITVFNLIGEQIAVLKNEQLSAGRYGVAWNGMNENGEPVSSGVYLIRMEAGPFTEVRKMVLAR